MVKCNLKFLLGLWMFASIGKVNAGENAHKAKNLVDSRLRANIQKLAQGLKAPYDSIDDPDMLLYPDKKGFLNVNVSDFSERVVQIKNLLSEVEVYNLRTWDTFTPLHFASLVGDAKSIRELAQAGYDVNAKVRYLWWTPLHFAILGNHTSSVQTLLSLGADSNTKAVFDSSSPQHLALLITNKAVLVVILDDQNRKAGSACSFTLVYQLLDRDDCDTVRYLFERKCEGENALQHAVRNADKSHVKRLLDCSVNTNEKNVNGETAMHIACSVCNSKIIDLLMNSGAQTGVRTYIGLLPIHYAIKYHNVKTDNRRCVEQLILRGSSANRETIPVQARPILCLFYVGYNNMIDHAISNKLFDSCEADLKDQGLNALHLALIHDKMDIVRLLHFHGFQSNFNRKKYFFPFSSFGEYSCDNESKAFELCADSNWKNGFMIDLTKAPRNCGSEATALQKCIIHGHYDLIKKISDPSFAVIGIAIGVGLLIPIMYTLYKTTIASYGLASSLSEKLKISMALLFMQGAEKQGIHRAISSGRLWLCKYLIKKIDCVNTQDENGTTPLMQCCKEGKENIFQFLLGQPTMDKNLTDTVLKGTALHWACHYNRVDFCKKLLEEGFDPDRSAGDQSLLHSACKNNNVELVNLFLQAQDDHNVKDSLGNTPLHVASILGHLDAVKALIRGGVDLEVQKVGGKTPLHCATECNHAQLSRSPLPDDDTILPNRLEEGSNDPYIEIIKLLLGDNADVHAKDSEGNTPLHSACHYNREKWYKALVERGADINMQNNDGETPLMVACKKGSKEVAALLLREIGLSRKARDKKIGGNALHVASHHGQTEMCRLLLEQGNFSPNDVDKKDVSLLHRACMKNSAELCRLFLRVQDDPNCVDKVGNTPLHYACRDEHIDIVNLLLKEETGKTVDLDARNVGGKTPLRYALEKKNEELVELLLNYNATVREQDILYGAQYSLTGICKYLKESASVELLNRIRGQLGHLVQGNEELIKLFGIYHSLKLLPARAQPSYDTAPEQNEVVSTSDISYNLGLQSSRPQLLEEECLNDGPQENTTDDNYLLGKSGDQVSEVSNYDALPCE